MLESETKNEESYLAGEEHTPIRQGKHRLLFWSLLFLLPLTIIYVYTIMVTPPKNFLPDTYIEVPKGYTLAKTAVFLKEHSIIRSETIFLFIIQREGKETGIQSGTYYFKYPINVFGVASRITKADYGIKKVKITLPEGITRKEMGEILSKQIPALNKEDFLKETNGKEGYLFPDTYFFFMNATSGPIIDTLEDNFLKQTASSSIEAMKKGRKWEDVLKVASLLEEEATTKEDRMLVSGIIWKRLEKNMPLQIDATLGYITGKGSLELTGNDLRSDTPYNTYTHKGLPPTPISNPGLDAIKAALYPTTSPYLYYLSDKNGVIHYAKTFEEHKLNKLRYLR